MTMELLGIIGLSLVAVLTVLLLVALGALWARIWRARRNASKTDLPAGITTQEFSPVEE